MHDSRIRGVALTRRRVVEQLVRAARAADYRDVGREQSAAEVDDRLSPTLFTGRAGTGKSTHTHIWQKVFGKDKALIINDDKPVIRPDENKYYAYGTPWSGKSDENLSIKVPLQGICFIERSKTNHIESISAKEAIPLILNQTVRPPEVSIMDKLLLIIDGLLKAVPFYRLSCNMEDEAALVSYRGMKDAKV